MTSRRIRRGLIWNCLVSPLYLFEWKDRTGRSQRVVLNSPSQASSRSSDSLMQGNSHMWTRHKRLRELQHKHPLSKSVKTPNNASHLSKRSRNEFQSRIQPVKDPLTPSSNHGRYHRLQLLVNQLSCLYRAVQRSHRLGDGTAHHRGKMTVDLSTVSRVTNHFFNHLPQFALVVFE